MQLRPSQQALRATPASPPKLWWPASMVVLVPIVLCVILFVLGETLSDSAYVTMIDRFALSTLKFLGEPGGVSDVDIIFSFISHAFLHNSPAHLGLNMLWLYVFGQPLAVRFRTRSDYAAKDRFVGSLVFVAFYLSAAVFSGLIYVLSSLLQPGILIGASGATSAVMGASVRVGLRRYQPGGIDQGRALAVWDWKVLLVSLLYISVNLALLTPYGGWLMPGADPSSIAWQAHIAGYLYGLIMFSYFDQLTTNRR